MALVLVQDDAPETPSPSPPRLLPSISIPAFTAALQERIQARTRLTEAGIKTDIVGQMRRFRETELAFVQAGTPAYEAFRPHLRHIQRIHAMTLAPLLALHDGIQQDLARMQPWGALAAEIRRAQDFARPLTEALEVLRQQAMTRWQELSRLWLDPWTIERRALVDVLEAVETGAAEEALTWLLGRLGLPQDHVTALWDVLLAQRWRLAPRPFAYVAKAVRALYRRQAAPRGRLFNGSQLSLDTPGPSQPLVTPPFTARDPLAEVEANCTLERACLLAGLTPDALTIAKLRLQYGDAITRRELPALLNWPRPRVEAALRNVQRKRVAVKNILRAG